MFGKCSHIIILQKAIEAKYALHLDWKECSHIIILQKAIEAKYALHLEVLGFSRRKICGFTQ